MKILSDFDIYSISGGMNPQPADAVIAAQAAFIAAAQNMGNFMRRDEAFDMANRRFFQGAVLGSVLGATVTAGAALIIGVNRFEPIYGCSVTVDCRKKEEL